MKRTLSTLAILALSFTFVAVAQKIELPSNGAAAADSRTAPQEGKERSLLESSEGPQKTP